MPGVGPPPKDPAKRVRRNKEERTTLPVTDGPAAEAPTLPAPPEGRSAWHEQTRGWWRTWVESPQAQMFADTDWQRLLMLVPLVEQFWTDYTLSANQRTSLLAEIRLNEAALGATVADRARLRWDLKRVDEDGPKASKAGAASMDEDRAARLLRAVK